jgi:sirohydrochlorin ferrochelatase
VIVSPFFLLPGRHWAEDIPVLTAEAAGRHPGVDHLVAAPLGLHRLLAEVMQLRIEHCLEHARGDGPACELCQHGGGCVL